MQLKLSFIHKVLGGKQYMLVTLTEVLKETRERKYAVGSFNATDYLLAEAVIKAAEEENVPVIMMVPTPAFKLKQTPNLLPFILDRVEKATVPICMHLDHGKDFDIIMQAIHYGCSSVMFDGSQLQIEENIAKTKEIVKIAHACGVSVEAEIGHVPGSKNSPVTGAPDESLYTNPEDAIKFVEETGVDALAISIGTVHGNFVGEPKLDFERLAIIREKVSVPLVLHGGSGLSEEDFRKCIDKGISKINFFTGLAMAVSKAAYKAMKESEGNIMWPEVAPLAEQAGIDVAKEQFRIFNTQPLQL